MALRPSFGSCYRTTRGSPVQNTVRFISSVPVGDDAAQFLEEGGIVNALKDIIVAASENGILHSLRSSVLALQTLLVPTVHIYESLGGLAAFHSIYVQMAYARRSAIPANQEIQSYPPLALRSTGTYVHSTTRLRTQLPT